MSAVDCFKDDANSLQKPPHSLNLSAIEAPLICFFKKLQNWIEFNEVQAAEIVDLAGAAVKLGDGDEFASFTNDTCPLLVLQSGVAYSYTLLPNGARFISGAYFPGDLLTYPSLMIGRPLFDYAMACNAEILFLKKSAFTHWLKKHENIAQIIAYCETARNLFLNDRFAAVTKLDGEHRVLHLLLEIKASEELTSENEYDEFQLLFTQEQIGDMLGLTSVYVSKMLAKLEKEKIIRRKKRRIRFVNRSAAEVEIGFVNRYRQIKGWNRSSGL